MSNYSKLIFKLKKKKNFEHCGKAKMLIFDVYNIYKETDYYRKFYFNRIVNICYIKKIIK